ncbi:MAG: cation diffusion facilitator family transporter [Firmicutes bacterium]|nr:cation diffusion facilitator family transporter [Bacillota bacterium]
MSGSIYASGSPEAFKTVQKTVLVTIAVNLVFVAVKLVFGIIIGQMAAIADAVYTFCVALAAGYGLLAQSIVRRRGEGNKGILASDGTAIALSALIFCAGVLFIVLGAIAFLEPKAPLKGGSAGALIAVFAASIVFKEGMYHFTVFGAKKAGSPMLKSEAMRHRIDALPSVAVLGGLICGLFFADDAVMSAAVMAVGAFMCGAALVAIRTAARKLLKKSAGGKQNSALFGFISAIEGVRSILKIETRPFGNSLHADVTIRVEDGLNGIEIKEITDAVADALESQELYDIKRCHVNTVK